ncbi:MAG: Minf_1886 family protein [Candidatus Omnitrophota bacterium]
MKQSLDDILDQICSEDLRYHEDAYEFVMDALAYAQKKFRRAKHVSGKELLEALKELAMNRFGPMALSVLQYWGLKSTEDVGNIVFNLIDKNVLSRHDRDSLDDFSRVYDFEKVFGGVYRNRINKKIQRMR